VTDCTPPPLPPPPPESTSIELGPDPPPKTEDMYIKY